MPTAPEDGVPPVRDHASAAPAVAPVPLPGAPRPAARRVMPPDLAIVVPQGRGSDGLVPPTGPRRHPMRGFEDTYVDIVDYVVRVTHRIWEDQDVGYIYDTYAPGCRVEDDSVVKHGVERIVTETLQSIHAFADCRHYAEEVIWAGDEDQGFLTSHRAVNTGHHTGPWRWGPATGRTVDLWVIADCLVTENEIVEEWVLYNTAARLAQLGLDVRAAARAWAAELARDPGLARETTEVDRLVGGRKPVPYPPAPAGGFDVEHLVRAFFHDVYTRRDLSAVDRTYAPGVAWNGATNRTGSGRGVVRAMARSLLATFPDLGLAVEDLHWMGNDSSGYRVAVRWRASGTHRGHGLYGAPTGRRVHLWGLQQMHVEHGEVVAEWMLFNEFDVMAQVWGDLPLHPVP